MLQLTAILMSKFRRLREEDGQGLTEYALILVLVAVLAIAALTLLGDNVTSALNSAANSL